jgi:putative restriction endonuclease
MLFAKLRTDKDRTRYPAWTKHRAPHKPILLLSVIDLMAQGRISRNFVEPSFELVEAWNWYWNEVMPFGKSSTMGYPFPRLQSDGFWYRVPNPGYDDKIDYNVSSMAKCREIYAGARMDKELYFLLAEPASREVLRNVLLRTYFAAEIQPRIADLGATNLAAYTYARELVSGVSDQRAICTEVQLDQEKIRDYGFRKAIVSLYDHRCALCGIRILTPEGHTVVEAAHIVPWSETHDDLPTNGLCLCRLCHWSFDEGLMSVGDQYEVLVSRRVRIERNMPGHILTLSDRPIFKPGEDHFHPSHENLAWHRKIRFI